MYVESEKNWQRRLDLQREIEPQMQRMKRMNVWTPKGEREVGGIGRLGLAYIHY